MPSFSDICALSIYTKPLYFCGWYPQHQPLVHDLCIEVHNIDFLSCVMFNCSRLSFRTCVLAWLLLQQIHSVISGNKTKHWRGLLHKGHQNRHFVPKDCRDFNILAQCCADSHQCSNPQSSLAMGLHLNCQFKHLRLLVEHGSGGSSRRTDGTCIITKNGRLSYLTEVCDLACHETHYVVGMQ